MRRRRNLIRDVLVGAAIWAALPHGISATGTDPAVVPPVNTGPCLAAIAATDDDRIVAVCGAVIDGEKTDKADRIKALIARAAVWQRNDMIDRAIEDYGIALRLDPSLADIFDARGELWRKKGDRPKALQDFGAALKLNPNHPAAKANYKSLALELERLGALLAVNNRPSFNCAAAKRPVERAICDNPELANLDRQINAVNTRVVSDATRIDRHAARALQHEQDDFVAQRNAAFGQPGYNLQKVMRERLDHLLAIGH
ncbi:MAG TPA: tetratricopeptide repeat protein [Bradyrhizobium sp.]